MRAARLQVAIQFVQIATLVTEAERTGKSRNSSIGSHFRDSVVPACELPEECYAIPLPESAAMDLTIWLPAMLLLGLAAVGLMFLFVEACDKV